MKTLSSDDLAARVRAWAKGFSSLESAVGVVIVHGYWLRREDFVARCVEPFRDLADDTPMAAIDWDEVPAFLAQARCSSSEGQILTLACSLAGRPSRESLAELVLGLDETGTRLLLQAVAHLAAWHERGCVALIDGVMP